MFICSELFIVLIVIVIISIIVVIKSIIVKVIVEDIISAITVAKVRPNVTGMAVLGTNINHTHMEYLEDYSKIIVALDPDATNKSIE